MTDNGKKDPDSTQPGPVRPRGSHKLWAILLVLDCVFVIIFGGAVAAKVYQHWQEPPPTPPPAAQKAKPAAQKAKSAKKTPAKKSPKKKTVKKKTAKKKAVAAKKTPAPKKKKTAEPAKGVKPPRPSLLSEAPKPREAPKPQGAKKKETPKTTTVAKAPPPPPKAQRPKAFPVDFKIKAPGAKKVQLTGMFLVRTGGKKDMVAKGDGLWALRLYLVPDTYQYLFIVDGKKTKDPENSDEKLGHSLMTVGAP